MKQLCDIKVHINGEHTFLLHQKIVCAFSGKLKRLVKQEKNNKRNQITELNLMEFAVESHGFELISKFCYNNGRISMTTNNVCILHSAALILEMTEEFSTCNLLQQTEMFLENMFYWSWNEILVALKSCESFFSIVDASGLIDKLISSLLSKISSNSDHIPIALQFPSCYSSSSSSSPDTTVFVSSSSSYTKTPEPMRPCINREWWFDDLTLLAPNCIEKIIKALRADGSENKDLTLTKFLLHYLKTFAQMPNSNRYSKTCSVLADTAVHGVVSIGRTAFSCRALFWVLRVVTGFGFGNECRQKLERLMGLFLDEATLDDLMVSGNDGGVYDVNMVLRLIRVFVNGDEHEDEISSQRMKRVGRLIDKYLIEIAPDHRLKVSKFLGVSESLPDSARDCFDGVYRALDIYLESHTQLTTEEKTTLCRCLNYEKLSLEACKDLAKNKRIPPGVAVQALVSQQSKLQISNNNTDKPDIAQTTRRIARNKPREAIEIPDEKEELKLNLLRMQSRVIELEKVCKDMKGQMSKMAKSSSKSYSNRGMSRMC